jgi:hypothetical protein
MNKNTFPTLVFLAVFSILVTSCSTAGHSDAQIPENAEATAVENKTVETSTPTPAPASTPTPEPILCTITFDSDRDGNWEIYRMFCKAPGIRRGDVRNGFAYIIQRLAV